MKRPTSRTEPVGAGPDFFDDAYYRLLAPFHTEADARREVAAVRELAALAQDERILDLGCGWGRHLSLLQAAGHDAIGVDLSVPLLRRARADHAREAREREGGETGGREAGETGLLAGGLDGRLVAGDMLRLPFADASFHAVLNLATSLGLFLEDGSAVAALREARRVLRVGGRLVLEGMHREDVEPDFAPRDRWELADGTRVRARRRFDPEAGVSHEVLRWDGPKGSGTKRHSLRVRSADEVDGLLAEAGFGPRDRYGDWAGNAFRPTAGRLVVVAGRGG